MSKVLLLLLCHFSFSVLAEDGYSLSFIELDRHVAEIKTFETRLKKSIKEKDQNLILSIYMKLNKSIERFTSYNREELIKIKEVSSLDKPIYGNELTYLSKSFSVYYSYYKLLNRINSKSIFMNNILDKNILKLSIALKKRKMFYGNYYPVLDHQRIRVAINEDDSTYKVKVNSFKKIVNKLLSKKEFNRIKRLALKISSIKKIEEKSLVTRELISDLQSNGELKEIKEKKYYESSMNKNRKLMRSFYKKDRKLKRKKFFVHHVSGSIGNLLGAVRWRKGRLLNNEKVIHEILLQLKPLDIITEKTWFSATDTLIPGHFGHNAIWLGTKEQLVANGMWTHPAVIPYHKDIEAGKSIIESDRTGTHLKGLREFMNVDEFAILRFNDLKNKGEKYIENLYRVALGQLGKSYDFNFDVETTDKIVCSELLYQTFGDIKWPTEKYLGRFTISPDNVASLSLYENSPLELIYYVAQKEKNISDLRYKNLDELANDIGFKKDRGKYSITSDKCTGKTEIRICKEEFAELIY